MASEYKIIIENDDGTESEFTVRADVPLAIQPGDTVEKFQALLAGVDVYDDVLTPDWYTEFFCFLWAIARLNPDWEVGRLLGAGITTTKILVGHGSFESSFRGGAQIDIRAAGVGSSVTVKGTVFTYNANPTSLTEWRTGDQLVFAIQESLPDVRAVYRNGFLFLYTRAFGYTGNAGLLADGFTIASAGMAAPTRLGGDALAPGGQFNVEASPAAPQAWAGAQMKIVLGTSYFPDHESLKKNDLIRFQLGGIDYTTKIAEVNVSPPAIEILLDLTNDFHDATAGAIAHPVAVTLLDEVEITYRRLPRLDDNPLFFMDEPIREQTDRFIEEIYDYLKHNTFGVKVDPNWLKDQGRLDQLERFLDRVRAVETNWIACSDLEGVDEIGVPFFVETTPTDASHWDPLPAFLIVDLNYLDEHYLS